MVMMKVLMKKVPIMTRPIDNFYFWLGEDGELEGVDKETFEQRQKEWNGDRPNDYVQE